MLHGTRDSSHALRDAITNGCGELFESTQSRLRLVRLVKFTSTSQFDGPEHREPSTNNSPGERFGMAREHFANFSLQSTI